MKNAFRFIALALVLMAAVAPVNALRADPLEKYYYVTPDQLAQYITGKDGHKRIVVVYASWCVYCRKEIPVIAQIEQQKKGSVIVISIDKNPDQLIQYIDSIGGVPFHVFMANESQPGELDAALKGIGIHLTGGIPFAALLNEDNSIFNQGNFNVEYLEAFILGQQAQPQMVQQELAPQEN